MANQSGLRGDHDVVAVGEFLPVGGIREVFWIDLGVPVRWAENRVLAPR
jgi:hypothetical protein